MTTGALAPPNPAQGRPSSLWALAPPNPAQGRISPLGALAPPNPAQGRLSPLWALAPPNNQGVRGLAPVSLGVRGLAPVSLPSPNPLAEADIDSGFATIFHLFNLPYHLAIGIAALKLHRNGMMVDKHFAVRLALLAMLHVFHSAFNFLIPVFLHNEESNAASRQRRRHALYPAHPQLRRSASVVALRRAR